MCVNVILHTITKNIRGVSGALKTCSLIFLSKTLKKTVFTQRNQLRAHAALPWAIYFTETGRRRVKCYIHCVTSNSNILILICESICLSENSLHSYDLIILCHRWIFFAALRFPLTCNLLIQTQTWYGVWAQMFRLIKAYFTHFSHF